jgi:hypothetical protein
MGHWHFYIVVLTSVTGGGVTSWVCPASWSVPFSAAGCKDGTKRVYSTVLMSVTGNSVTFWVCPSVRWSMSLVQQDMKMTQSVHTLQF